MFPFPIDPSSLNNEDPLFFDPLNNDYHIQDASPCINAGGMYAPELPDIDFEEDPRIIDGAPDIGADEALNDFQQEYQQDQANDVTPNSSRGCGTPPCGLESMFQSFTPSASPLVAVELKLRAGGSFPTTGYETTIRIRSDTPSGPVLGTATTSVPGPQSTGTEVNVRFEFSPRILLTPGNTYIIEWICPEDGGSILTWEVTRGVSDPYSGGTAFGCTGVPIQYEDQYEDFLFTTSLSDLAIFEPEVTTEDILEFFDQHVGDDLYGRGRGWLAKLRLCFMRNMLVIAGEFIERDRIKAACFILGRAYKRCDGERRPSDLVVGEAVPMLAGMINSLRGSLGCE